MSLTLTKRMPLEPGVKISQRLIGHLGGIRPGPSSIFIVGIHGNEPAGVDAIKKVFFEIEQENLPIHGNIYAILGNIKALQQNVRFQSKDLNRLWFNTRMELLKSGKIDDSYQETEEQVEILKVIETILESDSGPFYFLDLHTTSSPTIPFMTVSDSLLNRKFTSQFPVPMVLGIEEYLEGALLSYINEQGYVSFGFEGGQHNDPAAVQNHEAFIWLSLFHSECLNFDVIRFNKYYEQLSKAAGSIKGVFEIFHRQEVRKNDEFEMVAGLRNFQRIDVGQTLATFNGKVIKSDRRGRVFMPRYQALGDDGFFGIKRTPRFFLWLSAKLRWLHFDIFLSLLPGIKIVPGHEEVMIVNRKIARIFTKQIFHLLGYRSRRLDRDQYIMRNREANAKTKDYKGARWF